ncbi:MAG: class I SAM-dependent methyltransferase [Nitrosospira sp.]|nr:class I SAM-dependent methyltransferase [Nitrosospira sp.]
MGDKVDESLGIGLAAGDLHYRAYVGPPEDYDLVAAMSFGLLTSLGLRGRHRLLDIGCGSCRLGRLFIPYLNKGKYFGLEPNEWLVKEGIAREIGNDLIQLKSPIFTFGDSVDQIAKPAFFDFAIAQSIFSHCGQDLLEKHLAAISDSLKPNGALVATFIAGDVDSNQEGWVYPGCTSYNLNSMRTMACAGGFNFLLLDWLHPRQNWALFAKPDFDTSWLRDRPVTWNTWLKHGPK